MHELLRAAPVFHADETSARVAGVGHWVHSASTDRFTWQGVYPKSGVEGMDALGGAAGAHLLRELAAVAEGSGVDLSSQVRSCP